MIRVYKLMIGDWLLDGDSYAQVTSIACGGIIETTASNFAPEEILQPIPLTPEILEKNGFKVDGYAILNLQDGKWLEYYFHEHRFSMYYEGIDEWQNHSQVRDIVYRSQPFYVHELQHCLRLCCLNDLADNFKVEDRL